MLRKTVFGILFTCFILFACFNSANSQESIVDRFVQAQKLMGQKNYDSAIKSFKEIIRDKPDFGQAYEWLVLAFAYSQRLTEGQEYYDSLMEQDSLNANAHLGLGRCYQEMQDDSKALISYKRSMQLGCKYPSLYLNAARVWKQLGKIDEAVSFFEQLADHEGESRLADYGLAYVYYRQNNWMKAEQHVNRVLKSSNSLYAALLKVNIYNQQGGKQEEVIELCKVGIESANRDSNLKLQADFLGELSRAYRHAGNYPGAVESLEQALQIHREVGHLRAEGITLGNIGNVHAQYGRPKEALPYYEESLKLLKQLSDTESAITYINGLAIVQYKLGHPQQAISSYQEAIKIAKELGNLRVEANALNNLANLHSDQGHYPEASNYYRMALQTIRRIGNKRGEAVLLMNLGNLSARQGQYQQALEYYDRGLTVAHELNSNVYKGHILGNRGNVFKLLGHYTKALKEYEAALEIARATSSKTQVANILGNMGDVYRQFGDYAMAIEYIRQALHIYREAGNRNKEGLKLSSMAFIYLDIGEYSKALEYYGKALEIQKQLDNKASVSYVLVNMGLVYELLGEYSKAFAYYQRGLSVAREIGEKRNEGYACNHLGSYYSYMQDYNKSEKFHQRALQIGEELSVPEIIWDARIGLAVVLSKQNRIEEAWNQYKDAIRIIEDVEKNISADDSRIGFRERRQSGYEQLMSMLWELHQQEPAKGFDREMFTFAERTKARSLLELVNEGNIFQFLDEVSPDFRSRFLANATRLDELREELYEAVSQADSNSEQNVQRELRTAQTQRANLFAELEQEYPRYHDLITPNVLALEQVQQSILKENQILLQYFVGANNSYVFVLTRNDFSVTVFDAGRDELSVMLKEIGPLFQRKGEPPLLTSKDNIGAAPVRKDANWAQIHLDGLHEFYKRIFEPAIKNHSLEGKELIIVPDDILFYFPFEMLVSKIETGKPHYLLEDHAISYSASASLLNPDLKRQRKPTRQLLALGNPAFEKSKTGITKVLAGMFKSVFRDGHWIPLPYSEDEVRNIAKNFKDSEIRIGKRATEESFKQHAGQFRYLHIATHYLADDRQPMFSKMVFAQAPDNGEEDGYLHTFEVFNLDLNAEMVTLSACNTALGKFSRGEGIMGISRAFMYAGVPSLVVSLWPVEDESTAYLMGQFYKYLAGGDAKNVALQKAKLDLIKSDLEKNDPFYWAPFVLIGDWK